MSMKYRALAALTCALLLTGCGKTIEGQSRLSPLNSGDAAAESVQSEAEVSTGITRTSSLSLFKGESRTLDFTAVQSPADITVTSSDESIVSVNGLEVTAKKCGDAILTAAAKVGDVDLITTVNVTVSISRFDESIDYTPQQITSAESAPGYVQHSALKIGSTDSIAVQGADEVVYSSSDPAVAAVSESGEIEAVAAGDAEITAKATLGDVTAEYKTVLNVYKSKPATKIPQAELDEYFGSSVFVGCSLGVGHQLYLESQGENYLGGPLYLALSSYGIYNDGGINGSDYQLSYNGKTAPVKELLKDTGAKAVFINLGTNDMYGDAEGVGETFKEYIAGIREENPDMLIYIEALTPVYIGSETEYLNNENVDKLNSILKEYCDSNPDMYYIDINSIMKNDAGGLKDEYTSDSYVHLTNEANEAWTKKVVNFVKNQLVYEERAEDAVETYEEAGTETALAAAQAAIEKVGDGALKVQLTARLS